jgi:hypothetical protein
LLGVKANARSPPILQTSTHAIRGFSWEEAMKKNAILALAAAAALAACGGGGGTDTGGGGEPPPSLAFNLQAAVASTLNSPVSFTGLTGIAGSDTVVLDIAYAPQPDGAFQGQTYKRALETSTMTLNGALLQMGSTMLYYTPPANVVAATADPGFVTLVTPQGALPTSAFVGQSGAFYRSSTTLTIGGSTVPVGDTLATWSVEADSSSTAWGCITTTPVGTPSQWQKDCYRIDPGGHISAMRVTLFVDGQTLTLQ